MPYIKQEDREYLEDAINELAQRLRDKYKYEGEFAGLLNYTCTELALRLIPEKRYWVIALVSGVFHNMADEFYRRFAVPYEDEQIKNNGDVSYNKVFK